MAFRLLQAALVALFLAPLFPNGADAQPGVTELTTLTATAIQDAIDDCADDPNDPNNGGCHIKLPCGRYVHTASAASTQTSMLEIVGKQHVQIEGCGMNGTELRWDVDADEDDGNTNMILIEDSTWITIQDLKLHFHNDCTGSTCNAPLRNVRIRGVAGNAEDITFERVHFHHEVQASTPRTQSTAVRIEGALTGSPDVKRVSVYGSRIHTSGIGLYISGSCQDCWIQGTWFGSVEKTGLAPGVQLADKRGGDGVRFVNNTFDMERSGGGAFGGLALHWLGSGNDEPGSGAVVTGNSFINGSSDSSSAHQQMILYGYNAATIVGNVFDCESGGCNGIGIDFVEGGCDGECNRANIIADNMFDDFLDDGTTCPIKIPAATPAGVNEDNLIHGNLFYLKSTSTGTGVCGDATQIGTNEVVDNLTVDKP